MPYYTLVAEDSFLRSIKVGAGLDVMESDLRDGELWADNEITEFLTKRWIEPYPETIRKIANLLGSAHVLRIALRNARAAGGGIDYAKSLENEARRTMSEIKIGKRGLLLPDGSWDITYPENSNREQGGGGGARIIVG